MSKHQAIINLGTDAIVVALLSLFAFVPLKNIKAQEIDNSTTSSEKIAEEKNNSLEKKITVPGENTSSKPGVSLLMEQVRPHIEA